jgi:hypothetical protein
MRQVAGAEVHADLIEVSESGGGGILGQAQQHSLWLHMERLLTDVSRQG